MLLSSPPEAVATYHRLGSCSLTLMPVMRPPMLAGPMERQGIVFSHACGRAAVTLEAVSIGRVEAGCDCVAAGCDCVAGTAL